MNVKISELPIGVKLEAAAEVVLQKMLSSGMTRDEIVLAVNSGQVWEWAKGLILQGEGIEIQI